MRLTAFAKINLDLRILARRSDGYHEVRTILQTIDWGDEIDIEEAPQLELVSHGVEGGEGNLIMRAVRAFERMTGSTVRVRIELFKNIPAGAGLGGGSSDAAVTLLALNRLLGDPLTDAQLLEASRGLGADVAFFLTGGRGLGTGKGDQITPLDDEPGSWIIVVHPPVFISTAEAYSWLTVPDKSNSIMGFCAEPGPDEVTGSWNDFESVVFAHHPLLARIKGELLDAGALRAALSGSGSALYGVFASERAAEQALSAVTPYGNARVTRFLPRSEYVRRIWGVAKR